MSSQGSGGRSVAVFVALVVAMSVVFYLAGPLLGALAGTGDGTLPASALMFVCPGLAAAFLVYRRVGARGLRQWLGSTLALRAGGGAAWYAVAVLLMPLIVVTAHLLSPQGGPAAPDSVQWSLLVPLAVVYLVSATGEELGWTGYATASLQRRYGVWGAGVLLGVVWAVWHIIPYWQAGHGPSWILWQCLFTVGFRILLVGSYDRAGASVPVVIVCHASYNVAWSLLTGSGAHYDPAATALLTLVLAGLLVVISKAVRPFRSLRNRFASGD
ncbi:CPBP family intramembrane glutamic endopeptidase [Actinocorallia aurantiaca]|uniref:CAAX prenyl protease 2/Lysostaphin resistance protein A-like domain-containing protein n=1 Tax=Actinocorallia aurantiaca TaxID=46204 RepID=A0ABN3UW28_9ACTN